MKSLPIVLAFLSSSAFAVSVQFNFDINSSAPSIYPCDAGLKHEAHTTTICYNRETQQSCTPGPESQDLNCVCSGIGSEEYLMDSMTASVADWSDNGDMSTNTLTINRTSGESTFERLFSGTGEWNKQITSLAFNFASNRYGAEFYLDVCYRGPQVRHSQQGGTTPNHLLSLQSTITDLVASYSAASDLHVKAEATCDLQGEGNITYPANSNVETENEIAGLISGGDIDISSLYTSFSTGQTMSLITEYINTGNNHLPRFCKIRFSFLENMRNNTETPLEQLRLWELQTARISTLSDITPSNENI